MINPKDPSVNPIQSIGATKVSTANAASANKSGGQSSHSSSTDKAGQQHSQQHSQKDSQHSTAKPHADKASPANKSIIENPDAKQPTHSPQQQSAAGASRFNGKWDQFIGSAKTTWGKLTDDELLKSEGNMQKLSGLVEQRYALSKDIAETQVKKFLDTCSVK